MRAIRSYFAYIPLTQKLVQFVLMPLSSVAFAMLMILLEWKFYPGHRMVESGFPVIVSMYTLMLFTVFDVMFDRGNFGGTFSSKASWLEYMKSSARGLSVYQNILRGSVITRIVYAVAVTGIFQLILLCAGMQTFSYTLSLWLFFAGGTCLATQLGAMLTRFFASEQTSLMAGMISSMLVSILFSIASLFLSIRNMNEDRAYTVVGLLALFAGTALAYVLVVAGMKKKEREYYDV